MGNNIGDISRKTCTGCGACEVVCPVGCIRLTEDHEGFLLPNIDEDRCVDCAKCLNVCSATNDFQIRENRKALVYRSLLPESFASSSGGAAYALALWVIKQHGAVIACSLDGCGRARHSALCTSDALIAMQGSKYVQSDAREGLREGLRLVREGTLTLFIGTPCQVAAFRKLTADSPLVLTCDLVCHGVPSPRFWRQDLDYQNGRGLLLSRKDVQFRAHNKRSRVCFELYCKQYSSKQIPYELDPYYNLFIENASLRESCYVCPYSRPERVADLTLADCASRDDYWEFHESEPVSFLGINTERGEAFANECLEGLACDWREIDYSREVELNGQLHGPAARPSRRDEVYKDLGRLDYSSFANRYIKQVSPIWRLKQLAKRIIPVDARVALKRLMRRRGTYD